MTLETRIEQYRGEVYKKLNVEEIERQGLKLIPVLPILRRISGLKLRDGLSTSYILSVIADANPEINFLGPHSDQICANQIGMLADGIVDAGSIRWLNLVPEQNFGTINRK